MSSVLSNYNTAVNAVLNRHIFHQQINDFRKINLLELVRNPQLFLLDYIKECKNVDWTKLCSTEIDSFNFLMKNRLEPASFLYFDIEQTVLISKNPD